jgi:hypothetical protein
MQDALAPGSLLAGLRNFPGVLDRRTSQTLDSCRSSLAETGQDLPDADPRWKLDRELALSANSGRSPPVIRCK